VDQQSPVGMEQEHVHGAVQKFLLVNFGSWSGFQNTIQLVHDVEEFFGGGGRGN